VKLMRQFHSKNENLHLTLHEPLFRASRIDLGAVVQAVTSMEADLEALKVAVQTGPAGVPVMSAMQGIRLNDIFHGQTANFIAKWEPEIEVVRGRLDNLVGNIKRVMMMMHWDAESTDLFKEIVNFVTQYQKSRLEIVRAEELSKKRKTAAEARARAANEKQRMAEEMNALKEAAKKEAGLKRTKSLQVDHSGHVKRSPRLDVLHEEDEDLEEDKIIVALLRSSSAPLIDSDNVFGHPLLLEDRPTRVVKFPFIMSKAKDDTELLSIRHQAQSCPKNLRQSLQW